ncbi:sulfurtransferase TusA [Marinomonas pollencensis]|uniref:tRNA 2-thiouridine synthesizing protein A n=1 Tax=Marinomonas pollencensis TaxID=491954 RepID=A0A3E0DVN5_9GAMM|nr:sulfurtransferase TusA [Marinomonas pollencensis]REG85709.1 tRNA 2-thiouridine synthesizing protein A [Marinomonas pollencensis]
MEHQAELDASGLLCPEPVMMLHVEMRKLGAKEILKVTATDPSTTRDIPKFCNFLGHTLLEQLQEGECYYYWIEKKDS